MGNNLVSEESCLPLKRNKFKKRVKTASNSVNPILYVNKKGIVTHVNESSCKLFEVDYQTLNDRPFTDLCAIDQPQYSESTTRLVKELPTTEQFRKNNNLDLVWCFKKPLPPRKTNNEKQKKRIKNIFLNNNNSMSTSSSEEEIEEKNTNDQSSNKERDQQRKPNKEDHINYLENKTQNSSLQQTLKTNTNEGIDTFDNFFEESGVNLTILSEEDELVENSEEEEGIGGQGGQNFQTQGLNNVLEDHKYNIQNIWCYLGIIPILIKKEMVFEIWVYENKDVSQIVKKRKEIIKYNKLNLRLQEEIIHSKEKNKYSTEHLEKMKDENFTKKILQQNQQIQNQLNETQKAITQIRLELKEREKVNKISRTEVEKYLQSFTIMERNVKSHVKLNFSNTDPKNEISSFQNTERNIQKTELEKSQLEKKILKLKKKIKKTNLVRQNLFQKNSNQIYQNTQFKILITTKNDHKKQIKNNEKKITDLQYNIYLSRIINPFLNHYYDNAQRNENDQESENENQLNKLNSIESQSTLMSNQNITTVDTGSDIEESIFSPEIKRKQPKKRVFTLFEKKKVSEHNQKQTKKSKDGIKNLFEKSKINQDKENQLNQNNTLSQQKPLNSRSRKGKKKLKPVKDEGMLSIRLLGILIDILKANTCFSRYCIDFMNLSKTVAFYKFEKLTANLQRIDLNRLKKYTENKKIAFFINIYNLLFVHSLIKNPHPYDFNTLENFMYMSKYNVGGNIYTLADIKFGVFGIESTISSNYSISTHVENCKFEKIDPKIHFSLINFTNQSPILSIYDYKRLDAQLSKNTIECLNRNILTEPEYNQIFLPKLFEKNQNHFGSNKSQILLWIRKYINFEDPFSLYFYELNSLTLSITPQIRLKFFQKIGVY
ncbi:electron carrier/ protein disulfide oxidoreductase [Anaeramoeba flamelloides]|uniref:Electron carrier/ protein disulfide oxidoreductase n=1 Tax=Anaeramoeba flamelloides TaxID=1746091 RepID=A0ABQ8XED6_9EUKA|nr:electron carrier/ protein disulfide oxidoreductase [Anaeramoeba flamelloides]